MREKMCKLSVTQVPVTTGYIILDSAVALFLLHRQAPHHNLKLSY